MGIFFISLLCTSITALLFGEIIEYFNIKTGFNSDQLGTSSMTKFIFMVLVFPFLETLVFQHVPAKLNEYFGGKEYLIILTSALLFGLYHFYSWIYIMFGFCLGIIFILFYLRMRKYGVYPLIITFLLHGAHNGVGFILFELL